MEEEIRRMAENARRLSSQAIILHKTLINALLGFTIIAILSFIFILHLGHFNFLSIPSAILVSIILFLLFLVRYFKKGMDHIKKNHKELEASLNQSNN